MSDTTTLEHVEEELSWAGLAAAEVLRAVELLAIALLVLLVSPPLLILAVVVLVPAIVLGAIAGVVMVPVLAVRHVHRHHRDHPRHVVRRLVAKVR